MTIELIDYSNLPSGPSVNAAITAARPRPPVATSPSNPRPPSFAAPSKQLLVPEGAAESPAERPEDSALREARDVPGPSQDNKQPYVEAPAPATSGQVTLPVQPAKRADPQALTRYSESLRAAVERKRVYPRLARRLHQQGTVRLRFSVARDGRLLGVSVARSSGEPALDQAAAMAVHAAAPFAKLPFEVEGDSLSVELPFVFRLND